MIRLFTDNTGVMYCINNGYSKAPPIQSLLLELFSILADRGASIKATYLPGVENTQADALSRLALGDNWQLDKYWFTLI